MVVANSWEEYEEMLKKFKKPKKKQVICPKCDNKEKSKIKSGPTIGGFKTKVCQKCGYRF